MGTVDLSPLLQALEERRAQISPIIVFDTIDPVKVRAYVDFLKSHYQLQLLNPWQRNEAGEFEPLEAFARRFMERIRGRREGELPPAAAVFGFTAPLAEAMRPFLLSLLYTDAVYDADAAVFLFTESPRILGEEVLRYSILVHVPPSTEDERLTAIKNYATALSVPIDDVTALRLARSMRGLPLHHVTSAILYSIYNKGVIDADVITKYKTRVLGNSGLFEDISSRHGFEAVGGYNNVKEFLKINVIKVYERPDLAERLGIPLPRGLLFFGPPGTGKSWMARALARELGVPLLRLKFENILTRYYGESTSRLDRAIRWMEDMAPVAVFIDEIDQFTKRSEGMHEETRRVYSRMLEWLGDPGRRTFIVAATNRPQDIDEALIRAGRFDYIVPILYPDAEARLEILRVHTSVVRHVPLAEDVNLEEIAVQTNGLSGAEIETIVVRAAKNALREGRGKVTMSDFYDALDRFNTPEDREREVKEYLQLAARYTNDRLLLGGST